MLKLLETATLTLAHLLSCFESWIMANRRGLYEESIKNLGGQVVKADNGKVNIIYPDSWLDHPMTKKRKKK
jgi:hypothetical protein